MKTYLFSYTATNKLIENSIERAGECKLLSVLLGYLIGIAILFLPIWFYFNYYDKLRDKITCMIYKRKLEKERKGR